MDAHEIKDFQTLVQGPGALGSALAADVLLAGEPVAGLGWRPGGLAFVLDRGTGVQPEQPLQPFTLSVGSSEAEALVLLSRLANPGAALALLVTLPPEHQAVAGADAVVRILASRPHQPLLAIFGGNGLLPDSFAEAVRARVPRDAPLGLARALFYAGFLRERRGDELHVVHTGGHRVVAGALDDHLHSAALLGCYLNAVSRRAARVGEPPSLFRWEFAPDVRAAEWTKFYVNFLIALGTGPHAHCNGALFLRSEAGGLSPESALAWAKEFARIARRLAPPVALEPETLVDALTSTVESTAQNVNSVSLAASRGDASAFAEFVQALEAAADGSERESFVWAGCERARVDWRIA